MVVIDILHGALDKIWDKVTTYAQIKAPGKCSDFHIQSAPCQLPNVVFILCNTGVEPVMDEGDREPGEHRDIIADSPLCSRLICNFKYEVL
jgi:hypothetical protein